MFLRHREFLCYERPSARATRYSCSCSTSTLIRPRAIHAVDERAILAYERHRVATSIDHRDIVGDPEARGLCLGADNIRFASSSVRLMHVRGMSSHPKVGVGIVWRFRQMYCFDVWRRC